jgi:hypothetical protein
VNQQAAETQPIIGYYSLTFDVYWLLLTTCDDFAPLVSWDLLIRV